MIERNAKLLNIFFFVHNLFMRCLVQQKRPPQSGWVTTSCAGWKFFSDNTHIDGMMLASRKPFSDLHRTAGANHTTANNCNFLHRFLCLCIRGREKGGYTPRIDRTICIYTYVFAFTYTQFLSWSLYYFFCTAVGLWVIWVNVFFQ